jgi:hypothetical protein
MTLADALGLSGAKALARSVRGEKQRVIALDDAVARALEQAGHLPLAAHLENGKLLHDGDPADALCLSDAPEDPALLRECARAVRPGGRVLVATGMSAVRRDRQRIMSLLLHAGLVDLEQRWSRGVLLSSGRVRV